MKNTLKLISAEMLKKKKKYLHRFRGLLLNCKWDHAVCLQQTCEHTLGKDRGLQRDLWG